MDYTEISSIKKFMSLHGPLQCHGQYILQFLNPYTHIPVKFPGYVLPEAVLETPDALLPQK